MLHGEKIITNRIDKTEYYNYFSTINWEKLDAAVKKMHTLNCEECNRSCFEIHARFPSKTPKCEEEKNNLKPCQMPKIEHAMKNLKLINQLKNPKTM